MALDQELSSRYVDCVRESAEIINLGCLTPVFEAPDACQEGNDFPYYFAAILYQGGASPTRFPRALPLRPEIRTRRRRKV